jgi:hypothetical protein
MTHFLNGDSDQIRILDIGATVYDAMITRQNRGVRTHPISDKKALFVNPQFTQRINGLKAEESDVLLRLLYEQAHVPEYQFRLRWNPGTIVLGASLLPSITPPMTTTPTAARWNASQYLVIGLIEETNG